MTHLSNPNIIDALRKELALNEHAFQQAKRVYLEATGDESRIASNFLRKLTDDQAALLRVVQILEESGE